MYIQAIFLYMNWMKKIFKKLGVVFRRHGVVIFLHFFLTLVFSSFLFPVFFTHIPGQPGDAIDSLHKIGAPVEYILSQFDLSLSEGFYALWNYKFSFLDLRFYSGVLTLFFDDVVAYNISWMLSFFFAAIFAYALVYYLLRHRYIAFLGGFLFSFAPVHFAYGNGFAGALHLEVIPLFLLLLLLFLNKFSWPRFVFLVLGFGLMIFTEHHFGYFGFLFAIPVLIFFLNHRKSVDDLGASELKRYVYSVISSLFFVIVFAFSFLEIVFSEENYLRVMVDEMYANSLDFFHFFTPSLHHAFWGDFFSENIWSRLEDVAFVERKRHFSEVSGFVTFSGIFFFIVAWTKRLSFEKETKTVLFWAALAISFFLVSMGPILSVLGPVVPAVPLPAVLLYEYLPFMDNIRTIGRVFPFGLIAFTISVSFGLLFFYRKISKKFHLLFSLIVFGIILIELVQFPPVVSIEVPGIVPELQSEESEEVVLNINSAYCYLCQNNFIYYGHIHKRQTLGGMWFGRQGPAEKFTVEKTTPFIKEILYNVSLGEDLNAGVFKHNYNAIATHMLEEENVKYLLYDTRFFLPESVQEKNNDPVPRPSTLRKMHNTLTSFDGVELYKSERGMVSYRVEAPNKSKDYILLRQPKSELNHFVKNTATGEEYIPFENGNVLQLENYTEDNVYVRMQLSTTIDGPVHITYAGQTYELDVTQTRRWYGLVLPKTENEIEILDFGIGDEIEVRAHSIYYEAANAMIGSLDEQVVDGAVSVISYDDSVVSGFIEKDLTSHFGETQEAILHGVLDWDAIARNRGVYAPDYFRTQLYIDLKDQNIRRVVFEKFNQVFTQAYSNFVQIDLGLLSIKEDTGQFVVYQLNNFENSNLKERLQVPLIYFLGGVDALQINPDGLEQQPIYSYRNVEPEFMLGSFEEVTTETNLSFELYPSQFDFSLDDYQIEVIDKNGERVRSIPFSRKVSIDILGGVFEFAIKDSEGELLELKKGQSIALYNVDFR